MRTRIRRGYGEASEDDGEPMVGSTWLKHPRGWFVFVLPTSEIDYFVSSATVDLPREIPADVQVWQLGPDEIVPGGLESSQRFL